MKYSAVYWDARLFTRNTIIFHTQRKVAVNAT